VKLWVQTRVSPKKLNFYIIKDLYNKNKKVSPHFKGATISVKFWKIFIYTKENPLPIKQSFIFPSLQIMTWKRHAKGKMIDVKCHLLYDFINMNIHSRQTHRDILHVIFYLAKHFQSLSMFQYMKVCFIWIIYRYILTAE
jgi:hypothetical protein